MVSVAECYGQMIGIVEKHLEIPGLYELLANQTMSHPDGNKDMEYFWQLMNDAVEHPMPVDKQRTYVMEWVGYLYGKLHYQLLVRWFPKQATQELVITPEEVDQFRVHVDKLWSFVESTRPLPRPKLVRSTNASRTAMNGVPINRPLVEPSKPEHCTNADGLTDGTTYKKRERDTNADGLTGLTDGTTSKKREERGIKKEPLSTDATVKPTKRERDAKADESTASTSVKRGRRTKRKSIGETPTEQTNHEATTGESGDEGPALRRSTRLAKKQKCGLTTNDVVRGC